jgi:hypothetical protein
MPRHIGPASEPNRPVLIPVTDGTVMAESDRAPMVGGVPAGS